MKVAMLSSGGVDSSLALQLLIEKHIEVEAFYLKIWLEDELDFLGTCPWEEDLLYVRELCATLDVPLHIVPLQQTYRDRIIEYALKEARLGRTPNPDLLCNNRIKFGAFMEGIDTSFDRIATGHYAQRKERDGIFELHRSPDPIKDQTYFLAHLDQKRLSRAMFPIGNMEKNEVRYQAHKYQLPSMDRKDSQGLCFLGKIRFSEFLASYLGEKIGPFIETETGKTVGEHRGYWFYTNGQRRGLGLSGGPWYVVGKDIETNRVFISCRYFSPEKSRNEFICDPPHWISGRDGGETDLQVKIRHGAEFFRSKIEHLENGGLRVLLDGRDQGMAPGQFAVFYDGSRCLGCAAISSLSENRLQ